jgi:DNA-binding response OmpR family regulator
MTGKKHIHIIEDDTSIIDVLTLLLENAGYEVSSSVNGHQILHPRPGTRIPHCILLDLRLTGADGRYICTKLKSADATKGVPVLIMSANSDGRRIAALSGSDGFIAKPFTVAAVLKKIEGVFIRPS